MDKFRIKADKVDIEFSGKNVKLATIIIILIIFILSNFNQILNFLLGLF